MKYRIKYWRIVNDYYGEWVITGLMTRSNAERFAGHLRESHEMVEVYRDEYECLRQPKPEPPGGE